MPPMPTELEEEAWRRRSTKRQSYTSQMACGTIYKGSRASTADPEKATRPFSQISSTSTTEVWAGRTPRRKPSKPDHDVYGDLHWDINARNPRNWSKRKKWAHTLVASGVTFTITLASSIVTPARGYLIPAFDTTSAIATLPLSLFLLGLAFGPFISRCCCAVFGRKIIYIVFVLLFAIFTLVAGLVDALHGIIICRMFAGVLAGPALSQGCAIIGEMWAPENRTEALLFYYTMPLLGPVVGLVIGGYVRWSEQYNWTRYVVLFASAACIVPIVFISETSRKIIMRRQLRDSIVPSSAEGDGLRSALVAPLQILFSRPAALLLSLQSGYAFAVLYASFVAFPRVLHDVYAFDVGSQGLLFLSMVIGIAVGYIALVLHHKLLYAPRAEQWQAQRASEAENVRRTARNTRNTRRSATSNFSRPNIKPRAATDSSTNLALSHQASRPASKGMAEPPVVDKQRNASLAAAAAAYLNRLEANRDAQIQSEQIALILNTNPAFSDLCAALESYHLKFDTVQLAKVLVDALPPPSTSDGPATPQRTALISSKHLHRSAAAARLDEPAAEAAPPLVPRLPTYYTAPPEPQTQTPTSAPPEWRLLPTLPASLLLATSLFLFAWTARASVHWIVPCLGMALFAFSALLTFVSTELYISDRYGAHEGASALAGALAVRYLMGFAFAMVAVPMYDRLGVGWGTSVLGFGGLVMGGCSWVLVFAGRGRRKGRR
ncbi:hypothetical protein B0A55_01198 [Friedmanniomyces simplex]|uniref:Major facilitator superfamily (MFS) profile domain-containing protein n=1 Tax=Friedmanniomyces simplex TaxID=329884 RepID=A0A4U0Y0K0_9PEZI|nr:hypothetical protein B0A55_01198 [Friedmanniomyces simplex]